MTFCNDIDLLHWEPNVLRDAAFASQTLISGTGNLAGTSFTISSGSLTTSHVAADQVIVLSGAIAGSFPIVSISSATVLALSVLYDGLYPAEGDPIPSGAGSANDLSFAIRTFWPQRRIVSELLHQAAGLNPAADNSTVIANPDALRRPCTLGTLHMIYSALAAVAEDPTNLLNRAELYERLYRRALRNVTLHLDLNADGAAETTRSLNVLDLQRI